jgi:hypothetical protein
MPGLLRGLARTAAVAGTATAVSNRVSRRQYNKWSQQDDPYATDPVAPAQPAPAQPAPAPAPAQPDRLAQLKELGELKAQGVLSEQEFATEKAKILNA